MSFYGSSFSFNGISCEEFGMMLYEFDSTKPGDSVFAKGPTLYEERVQRRFRTLYYDRGYEDALEFTIIFGANELTVEKQEPITRFDMAKVAKWLLHKDGYKWLSISQTDLDDLRFRCMITDLETIEIDMRKWAYKCTVHCDSPYAYTLPEITTVALGDAADIYSRANINDYYYPKIQVELTSTGTNGFALYNEFDSNRKLIFAGLPSSVTSVTIDCENKVITDNTGGLNLYKYCTSYYFPRLVDGWNHFVTAGDSGVSGTVTVTCEYPINIGG